VYAINDEYAEFRKALADGKEIESKVDHFAGGSSSDEKRPWKLDTSNKFVHDPKYYRIKPDKPEFKVGDWIVIKDKPYKIVTVYGPSSGDLYGKVAYANPVTKGAVLVDISSIKLWEPQPDEWCWFWDDVDDSALVLEKYIDLTNTGLYKTDGYNWGKCEPFIGELPTYVKG